MKTAVFMAKYRQLISQSDHRISLAYEIIYLLYTNLQLIPTFAVELDPGIQAKCYSYKT